MKHLVDLLNARPVFVSWLGTITGWLSVENIAAAKDWAQFAAATLAGLVSLCALILTAPKAWAMVRSWFRQNPQRDLFED